MKSAVVLIIIHKPDPSATELASLQQCVKILNKYEIVLIAPQGLNIQQYKNVSTCFSEVFIDPTWQSSYRMFNRLKIAPLLYKMFSHYKYVLFYELDAWVFKDELEYWCSQDYDYIGAPWFDSFHNASERSVFIGVGNGGFSLRKVSSHLKALRTFRYLVPPGILFKKLKADFSFKKLKSFIKKLTIRNNTFSLFNDYKGNEDLFWCTVVPSKMKWFKIPQLEVAMKFSLEVNAKVLFEKNDKQLPFGCHKWEKYDTDFWKQFINTDSYNHNIHTIK